MPVLSDEHTVNFKPLRTKTNDDALVLPVFSYNKRGKVIMMSGSEHQRRTFIHLEDYLHTIKHYFKKYNKKYIVFNDYLESPRLSYIGFLQHSVKNLANDLGIDPCTFKYYSGVTNIPENEVKYKELLSKNNTPYVPIQHSSYFENVFTDYLNSPKKPTFLDTVLPKKKKFIYLAGSRKMPRTWMLINLFKNNILDSCEYSFFSNLKGLTARPYTIPNPLFSQEDIEIIKTCDLPLPKYATMVPGEWDRIHQLLSSDIELYSESYLSIVSETVFFNYRNPFYMDDTLDYHYDLMFLTEKTYRPIALKHPFIIAGLPKTLKALRDMGYKTFSPYIDESYDEIEDDVSRLHKVFEVIKTFNNYTEAELIDFYHAIQPIVEHNFNVISSRRYDNML